MRINRLSHDSFVGPAVIPTAVDGVAFHAEPPRPFCEGHSQAVVRDKSVASHIVLLNAPRHPPAVLWRVRAIIVDTVDAVLECRAWTHVGIEGAEVMRPSLAHDNASAAVVFPLRRVGGRILASLFHAPPDAVLGRLRSVMRPACASATDDVSASKICSFFHHHNAAVTATSPVSARALYPRWSHSPLKNEQPTKLLACHSVGSGLFSHGCIVTRLA
jgi:hypothetical protein